MGTHPIFESDFDCLTDLRYVWQVWIESCNESNAMCECENGDDDSR